MGLSRDHAIALQWLETSRLVMVAAEGVYLGWATSQHAASPEVGLTAALLLLVGMFDVCERLILRRVKADASTVIVHASFDVAVATAFGMILGGFANPAVALIAVEVAIVSITVTAAQATTFVGIVLLLKAASVTTSWLVGRPGRYDPSYGIAESAGLALSVIGIALVLQRMAAALHAFEDERRAAEQERAHLSRLAALGTLAAGTAHELSTPLGTILLVIEEVEVGLQDAVPERELLSMARAEVVRCRDILDRMRTGSRGGAGQTPAMGRQVQEWVAAWRVANPSASPEVVVPDDAKTLIVRGEPEGWRRAIWTVLDNAQRAGGPVRIGVSRGEADAVSLTVENQGVRLDPAVAARIGEPFFTAWPDGVGTGLGVYASRVFARAAGGDLRVFPRSAGGARVVITLRAVG